MIRERAIQKKKWGLADSKIVSPGSMVQAVAFGITGSF